MLQIKVLQNDLAKMASRLSEIANEETQAAGELVEEQWRANIIAADLIDSGEYRDSVAAERTGDAEWTVGTDAVSDDGYPYPVAQEYGTSRGVPASGVATKAADEVWPEFKSSMENLERRL